MNDETNSEFSDKKSENVEYYIDDNNTFLTESSNIISYVSNILNTDESIAESIAESKIW